MPRISTDAATSSIRHISAMILLHKVFPIVVTAALAALAMTPGGHRPFRSTLGHVTTPWNWWFLNPNMNQYRSEAKLLADEKRSGDHAVYQTVPKCVCPHVKGYYDLGRGMYPRYVIGTECLKDGMSSNLVPYENACWTHESAYHSPCCSYLEEDFECRQVTYSIQVLAKGNNPAGNKEHLPEELRADWTLISKEVNSSCELFLK